MKKIITLLVAVALLAPLASAQSRPASLRGAKAIATTAPIKKSAKALRPTKANDLPFWRNTMSYCMNKQYAVPIGTPDITGDTVSWGIRIPASALAGREHLTSVEFFVAQNASGMYEVSVYFGTQPIGTPAWSLPVNVGAADTMRWKSVDLTNNPLPIDTTQDMWVIVSNSTVTSPAAGAESTGYLDGQWICVGNDVWFPLSQATNFDYTWMVRATTDTYAETVPRLRLYGPGSAQPNEPVSFFAVSPNASSYAWTVDGTPLNTTDSVLTHTFTTRGLHQVVVAATNHIGTTTDTLSVNVVDCGSAISQFPYTESFEGAIACWSFVVADHTNDARSGITPWEQAFDGNSVFTFSSFYEAPNGYNQYLISPELNLSNQQPLALTFHYVGYNSEDAFRVLASTTTNDTAAFTTVLADFPSVPNEAWTEGGVILPPDVKYIAFEYYGNYRFYLFLDAVRIEEFGKPHVTFSCADSTGTGMPTVFKAVSVLADSLSWEIDGATVAGGRNGVLTHTFTTTGQHTVAARAFNVHGDTAAVDTIQVYDCDGITAPYAPSFEQGLHCWQNRSDSVEHYGWGLVSDFFVQGLGQVVSFSAYSLMGSMVLDLYSDNWLISPAISTTDNDRYEVSWSVAAGSDYYCKDHYGVYMIVGTDTTLLFEETLTAGDATAFRPCTVALPASLNGEFRIAFRHFNSTGGYMVILDNIAVRRLTAPTVTLNGPSAVNHNTDVTYTALSGSADTYHWSVDGQPVDGSSSTLTTRFSEPGNHNVRVTATNSVGSAGASLDVQVFNCDPVTQFPFVEDFEQQNVYVCWDYIDADGDSYGWEVMHNAVDDQGRPMHIGHNSSNGVAASASYVGSGQSGTPLYPDNWMILPAMSIPAGQHLYLSWYDKGMHPQYAAEKYSVYISTSGREVRDFTLAGGYTATPYWTGHSIDLQSYAGQTIYIAFRHHNVSDMYVLEIDDISVSGQALGINEASSTAAFSLYPNPASSSVLVSGLEQGAQVSVVDMNGRVLNTLTAQGSSLTLDVSGMARGAYFVRVSTATNSSVSKLIVK